MHPETLHESSAPRAAAWAVVVALASLAVAGLGYGILESARLAAVFTGHEPTGWPASLALLGAAQLPVGLAFAVLGARRRPAAAMLALAWAALLVVIIGVAAAAGFRFELAEVALAYAVALLVVTLAIWQLRRGALVPA